MKSVVCDGEKKVYGYGYGYGIGDGAGYGYWDGDGNGFGYAYGAGNGNGSMYWPGNGLGFDPKDTPDRTPLDLTITHSEDLRADVVLTLTQQLRRYPP